MPSGFVINNVKDVLAAAFQILESAREEVVWLVPASINSLSMTYEGAEKIRAFVQKGGVSRGIVTISPANVGEIKAFLDAGEDIRHSDEVHEFFMFIGDKQRSISAINIGVDEYALDTPVTAFWTEDSAYAEYLLASFEKTWANATPAEERIQALLKHDEEQR